ncbi:hypothetical protein [Methylobacterium currus]|uniref:hypothetical protein n=1 Tax=Methylobacterium currus TaxID=2051553 RepID=UPI000F508471|nr:hypothetical protein [Methylobacterium currus]
MTSNMQSTFKRMCEARGLWHGAEVATHQDLSALFVARAVQLYLRIGGRFGMVMPNAVVDRESYRGFRTGIYEGAHDMTQVVFETSWDLRRIRPHFFPRGASVIFGTRSDLASAMPTAMEVWSGRVLQGNVSWSEAKLNIQRNQGVAVQFQRNINSPYMSRFRQGAIIAPRVCFVVNKRPAPLLGNVAGTHSVISSRSVNEKKPWKEVPSITGFVEERFIRPFYSGENLLPFRIYGRQHAVIPVDIQRLMQGEDEIEVYPGLSSWWNEAERIWNTYRSNENLSLMKQLDYMGKFSSQFPMAHIRVIYNTAGMHLSAAKVDDPKTFVDSNLYWCNVQTVEEANYLCCILNCPTTTEMLRPLMSYGKDERHVHKHIWQLPIQEYDASNSKHARLAFLGGELTLIAASYEIRKDIHFSAARRDIRNALDLTPAAAEVRDLVYEMLS